MGARSRGLKTPPSDCGAVEVEAHPNEPERWCWIIRLNGEQLTTGGCFHSVRAAKVAARGSLRVRQAIHYGQGGRPENG